MKFRFGLILFVFVGWCLNVQAANVSVIAPLVGDSEKHGQELIEGAQIAIDIINEAGGLLGEKVNLVRIDDQCGDSFSVSTAHMITLNSSENDKVDLVIGPYCDNAFKHVSDIYSKAKMIRVVPTPLGTEQYYQATSGLFKIGGLMSEQAKAFFDFYKKRFADKNLAMVYDGNIAKTAETAVAVQQLFRQNNLGNKVTLYDFENYNKDYTQMAKEILLNSQIVYVLGGAKPSSRLVQRLQEAKNDTVIFIDEYLATSYFLKDLGNFAEGIYVLALKNLKDNPQFTEELVNLRLKGKEPRGLGVYGYAAVKLWSQMVEESKSVDFDKIIKLPAQKSFVLPWGKVSFDQGRVSQTAGYGISQIKNGEYTQVD